LDLNGFEVDGDADALAELVIDVTLGKSGKVEVADFFRRHAVPRAE
jgi:prophage maintenance system killer protein